MRRLLYIENKNKDEATIGYFKSSRTLKTIYYKNKKLQSCNGKGIKGNYFDVENPGDEYWVSGPKKNGEDRMFGKKFPVIQIEEDAREYYWIKIRNLPENVNQKTM